VWEGPDAPARAMACERDGILVAPVAGVTVWARRWAWREVREGDVEEEGAVEEDECPKGVPAPLPPPEVPKDGRDVGAPPTMSVNALAVALGSTVGPDKAANVA